MPFWYGMLLNPIRTGGYWQYRDIKKRQEANNKLAVSIKAFTAKDVAYVTIAVSANTTSELADPSE